MGRAPSRPTVHCGVTTLMIEVSSRPARRDDLPFIGKLCARSVSIHQEGIGYPRCEDETELLAELALYENAFEDSIFVVCGPDGSPIGFAGFLVSDTDDVRYLIGPLLDGPWRTAPVAAEVLRELAERPVGGRPLVCYVEDENTVLVQALQDTGWKPGAVQLEMRYEVSATAVPRMEEETHSVRRLTGREDPAFPRVAELLGRQHGWSSDFATRLADYLDDCYHVALVEEHGYVAGCVLWVYVEDTDFGRLDYLSVDEAFRCRSRGSVLTRHVLADAHRTDSVEYVYLSLDPSNEVAHRLYRRHGFTDNVRSRKFTHECQ